MKKLFTTILIITLLILLPVQTTFASFDVRVDSSESSIYFRTSPETGSTVILEIPNGTVLTIEDFTYNSSDDLFFGETYYNGQYGWVSLRQTDFLSTVPAFHAVVSSSEGSIFFRSGAATDSGVICEIPNGTELYITDMQYNSWDDLFFGLTTYNGMTGWVSLRQTYQTGSAAASSAPVDRTPEYDTPVQPSYDAGRTGTQSVDGLSVRTDVGFEGRVTSRSDEIGGSIIFVTNPSASSALICEIPNNNTLTIYDIVRNEGEIWLYTEYNGTYGWILLTETVTPMHDYQIPDYIRDWDGTIAGNQTFDTEDSAAENTDEEEAGSIIGNWEYEICDEVPDSYHQAGYCFYENGTGLDTFWNETFTYSVDGDIVTIVFDNPEYGIVHFGFSFWESYSGNIDKNVIVLEYLIDDNGTLLRETQLGSSGNGYRKQCYADLSAERLAAAYIHDDDCWSWDSKFYLTTEDGVTATISKFSYHYNAGQGVQTVPTRVNGHRVTKIGTKAFYDDYHEELVIEEGIESVESNAFQRCKYKSAAFPASVQYIGADPFVDCKDLEVIYAPENSYAARYFQEAGYNVVYTR